MIHPIAFAAAVAINTPVRATAVYIHIVGRGKYCLIIRIMHRDFSYLSLRMDDIMANNGNFSILTSFDRTPYTVLNIGSIKNLVLSAFQSVTSLSQHPEVYSQLISSKYIYNFSHSLLYYSIPSANTN